MSGSQRLEFTGKNARLQFLRYLAEHDALATCCEKIVLEERFASLMPGELKGRARANLAAL